MTKAEQFECNRIIDQMVCYPESTQVARMGRGFHAQIEKKYGKEFAMSLTDRMTEAVCQKRMKSQAALIHPATGEVLE